MWPDYQTSRSGRSPSKGTSDKRHTAGQVIRVIRRVMQTLYFLINLEGHNTPSSNQTREV